MSSGNRKKLYLNTVSVSLGCGCRRPRLFDIFHPKPKHKPPTYRKNTLYHSSSTSWDKIGVHCADEDEDETTTTTATVSFNTDSSLCVDYVDDESDIKSLRAVQGFGRIGGESLAVEKDSDDPYVDFRRSMLQMILEKEIYSKDDLRELLNCFLQLNSPCHHGIILRAFTEIWNGVFSVKSHLDPFI
ncbi:transcription repressor OFP6-like [Cornus florida]|uniref:transcription repressor OFP6-like n=1 Tax=Cornus florida TaxID=4283 RepID=UPI0028A0ED6F|nr:transcription repressor OFP6-like [Cornus florida]